MYQGEIVRSGIGFGTALAIAISWSVNKSILWAILHGIFSWFYVIYYDDAVKRLRSKKRRPSFPLA
jgi:hypothetical protein